MARDCMLAYLRLGRAVWGRLFAGIVGSIPAVVIDIWL